MGFLSLQSGGSFPLWHAGCASLQLLLWRTGSKAQAQWLCQCAGSAALRHVGSLQTRHWTRVPCTGRRTPTHCTAREVHFRFVLFISKGTLLKFILS